MQRKTLLKIQSCPATSGGYDSEAGAYHQTLVILQGEFPSVFKGIEGIEDKAKPSHEENSETLFSTPKEVFKEITGQDVEDASDKDMDKVEGLFSEVAQDLCDYSDDSSTIYELEQAGFIELASKLRKLNLANAAYCLSREYV